MTAKKKATRKKATKADEKAIDDAALRAGYLEMYAGRDANKRLSRLRTEMGIRYATYDRWMQDPAFRAKVKAIDERRLESAEGLATTVWPEIVERQALIATGQLPDPPKEPEKSGDYSYQVRLRIEGYKAACAAAVKMSTRAAEFVGKYLHQLQQAEGLGLASDRDVFGRLSDLETTEAVVEEITRRQELIEAWRDRLKAKRDREAGGANA